MDKKFTSITCIFLMALLMVSSVSAITGVNKNARMVLYPEVGGLFATTIEKHIGTENNNDIPIKVTLQTEAEFIELIDEEFILEPGEEKQAKFLVKVKKEGRYDGKIAILFAPADPESKEAGVALSTTVIVIAKKDQGYEEEQEEDNEESENQVDVTGSVIDGSNENSGVNGGLILGVSSFVLLGILVGLMIAMSQKKPKKKKGTKKRGKKNARKRK